MPETRTISLFIDRSSSDLYEAIWRPEFFPRWASGLSGSSLRRQGERWRAEGPDGPVTIRFTDRNPFGVMDHHVALADGREIYIPLRVIAHGDGAEVLLTLFRQPDMTDERFQADIEWVERDLLTLKDLASAWPMSLDAGSAGLPAD